MRTDNEQSKPGQETGKAAEPARQSRNCADGPPPSQRAAPECTARQREQVREGLRMVARLIARRTCGDRAAQRHRNDEHHRNDTGFVVDGRDGRSLSHWQADAKGDGAEYEDGDRATFGNCRFELSHAVPIFTSRATLVDTTATLTTGASMTRCPAWTR